MIIIYIETGIVEIWDVNDVISIHKSYNEVTCCIILNVIYCNEIVLSFIFLVLSFSFCVAILMELVTFAHGICHIAVSCLLSVSIPRIASGCLFLYSSVVHGTKQKSRFYA